MPTRHEAYGSICKLLFKNMVKHRQGQTSVDRYVEGKTQEYSKSMRGSTIGRPTHAGGSKGLDNRGNPSTQVIIQTGQTEFKRQDERAIQQHKSNDQNTGKQARQD